MYMYIRRKLKSYFRQYGQIEKAEVGRWEESERRREEERRSEKGRNQKKEGGAKKAGKLRISVFPLVCDSGGSKGRFAKAAGAEPSGQMRDENLHAIVARSAFK